MLKQPLNQDIATVVAPSQPEKDNKFFMKVKNRASAA